MSRKKRAQDLRAAKDARMKKIAIGGAVLLVAVLAFEVPKMMHGNKTSSTAPATTTTAATTPGAPTSTAAPTPTATPAVTPVAAAIAVTPTASTKLTNSDMEPKLQKSQLYSFTHFAGKDPFVQQIKTSTADTSLGGSTTSTSPAPPAAGQTAAVSHKGPSRLLAANGSARIAINGQIQVVRVGAVFPSSNPLFRLISVANGVARIAIAHGAYSSGAKTVSLAPGRSLTLVDTADGIRYRIRLLA
jgi:hypothetical protein